MNTKKKSRDHINIYYTITKLLKQFSSIFHRNINYSTINIYKIKLNSFFYRVLDCGICHRQISKLYNVFFKIDTHIYDCFQFPICLKLIYIYIFKQVAERAIRKREASATARGSVPSKLAISRFMRSNNNSQRARVCCN